jgi:hypothetical protein
MCYSQTTSIISYTIGMLSAIFALYTRQYILGILILFYTQMQLSELMIWRGIDNGDTSLNKNGTAYGKYLLPTHNIAIGLGIILAVYMSGNKFKFKDFVPLVIGVVFYAYIILFVYSPQDPDTTYPANKSCMDKSCQNNENRLKWPYPIGWYAYGSFIISLIFMVIYLSPLKSKIFLGSFFTITFILSLTIYPVSVGSVWCFSTAILAPLVVLGNYYFMNY